MASNLATYNAGGAGGGGGDVLSVAYNDGVGKVGAVSLIAEDKASVRLITITSLPACTAAGSGAGKTLTINATNTAIPTSTTDGVAAALNDRILVANQAAQADNGIYTLTTLQAVGVQLVLTRATDYDASAKAVCGSSALVQFGNTQAGKVYYQSTANPITIDSSNLVFTQIPANLSGAAILLGAAGGQTLNGGTAAGDPLILASTTAASPTSGVFAGSTVAAATCKIGPAVTSGVCHTSNPAAFSGNQCLTVPVVAGTSGGVWVSGDGTNGLLMGWNSTNQNCFLSAQGNYMNIAGGVININLGGAPTIIGGNLAVGYAGSNFGIFGVAAATRQTLGGTITNNIVASGTTNQLDDFTNLSVYATDSAAIHADIYQLGRYVKLIGDGLRAYGWLT